MPRLRVIGVTDGDPVNTLLHPPAQYDRTQIDEFEDLRVRLRNAIAGNDCRALGEVATRSAEINQAFLPKPSFGILQDLARDGGAIGLSVSHSGSAVGLLFDPAQCNWYDRAGRVTRLLEEAGFPTSWTFQTGR